MNHPIAQLVALACHANARLRGGRPATSFLQENSTTRFCDRIAFVRTDRSWLGRPRETPTADDPDAWFDVLAAERATNVRLFHATRDHPLFPDRFTAGFVGGGGVWLLLVSYEHGCERWIANWEVWNREAPESRIWRVTYRGDRGSFERDNGPTLPAARAELISALLRIHAFAAAHDCQPFTDNFRDALHTLTNTTTRHGYHHDLDAGMLPADATNLLDAAQSAMVFGGMGSWNDMGFDGDAGVEYEASSAALYAALNDAIVAATNASAAQG